MSIRVLAPFQLKPEGAPTRVDRVIIHFHGGGFIATDSESHQCYTRKWANELNAIVFSVDYRMSPDSAYPQLLDDCY